MYKQSKTIQQLSDIYAKHYYVHAEKERTGLIRWGLVFVTMLALVAWEFVSHM